VGLPRRLRLRSRGCGEGEAYTCGEVGPQEGARACVFVCVCVCVCGRAAAVEAAAVEAAAVACGVVGRG